jgi:hypothetical protein
MRILLCTLIAVVVLAFPAPSYGTATVTFVDGAKLSEPPAGFNAADYPADPAPGSVRMSKSARWTDVENGLAEITIQLWSHAPQGSAPAGSNAWVTDILHADFKWNGMAEQSTGSVIEYGTEAMDSTYRWKVDSIPSNAPATLTIPIKLRDTAAGKASYLTNEGRTKVEYINFNNNSCIQTVESPVLSRSAAPGPSTETGNTDVPPVLPPAKVVPETNKEKKEENKEEDNEDVSEDVDEDADEEEEDKVVDEDETLPEAPVPLAPGTVTKILSHEPITRTEIKTIFLDAARSEGIPIFANAPLIPPAGYGSWSLLNMILMLLGFVCAVLTVLRVRRRWAILCIELAVGGLAIFLISQDMSAPMVWSDKWTIAFSLLFAAEHFGTRIAFRAPGKEEDAAA